MHKASFFSLEEDKIRCLLCPRRCLLGEGQSGTCGVRLVQDGELVTINYGCLAAAHWDPIEKKPLYHYYPGYPVLSIGTYGCNFLCSFCQNWSLARGRPEQKTRRVAPQEVLAMLEREGGPEKNLGLAYTYNEPLIWYEFVYDTARLLHEKGYRNILVSNGYIESKPFLELLPFIDAMNIDVKAFSDSFYRRYCHGLREPVLRTVESAIKKCHVEITCLLIPTLNDDSGEQAEMARWLGGLSPDLVLHYSRYFPNYKLDLPPTSPQKMLEIQEIARKELNYVYLGNIDLPGSTDTVCPHCGNLLVKRSGYRVNLAGLEDNSCTNCHRRIKIILGNNQ